MASFEMQLGQPVDPVFPFFYVTCILHSVVYCLVYVC